MLKHSTAHQVSADEIPFDDQKKRLLSSDHNPKLIWLDVTASNINTGEYNLELFLSHCSWNEWQYVTNFHQFQMKQGDVAVMKEENSSRSTLGRVDDGPNGKKRRQPEEIERT